MATRKQAPPPKKSKGLLIGLLIGGALLVIGIVVVVILVLRARAKNKSSSSGTAASSTTGTTPTTNGTTAVSTTCSSDSQCGGLKPKCDIPNNKCVACLATPDCPTPKVCNTSTKTCVSPQCDANSDCTGATSICSAGVCIECLNSSNCTANPINSNVGEILCDTSASTCKMCLTAADCGGGPNTCNAAGVCCLVTPPTITNVAINSTSNSSLNITYSYVKVLTGLQVIAEVRIPPGYPNAGTAIYTSAAVPTASTGTSAQIVLTETGMNLPQKYLYPGYGYDIRLKLVSNCGESNFSAQNVVTIPVAPVSATAGGNTQIIASSSELRINFVNTTEMYFQEVKPSVLVSKNVDFHPNGPGVFLFERTPAQGNCNPYPVAAVCSLVFQTYAWAAIAFPVTGQNWYGRGFFGKNYRGSINPPTTTTYLSEQIAFTVVA